MISEKQKRIIAKHSYFLVVDDGIIVVAICTFYIINMKKHLRISMSVHAMLKFYPDTAKSMSQDDAVKVAPDSYKVLLENDAVRVLEVRIKQGAKSEMHSHPRSVAICLNDQRLKFTFPNGKSEDSDLKRGQTVWLNGLSHAVENVGTEEVSSVVVELKNR
jgi:beta-alanine degradation protein BauB